ncbi:hypothetical protein [Paenibacillus aestuarii]|uniref:Uncharacterized protein n=1 Tax=Paenibacillus aestuarii TaxID=516965 RepID=A0ABW0K9I3_9BACL|nr:hypothetical protein [Paenibacillus aestuarii]
MREGRHEHKEHKEHHGHRGHGEHREHRRHDKADKHKFKEGSEQRFQSAQTFRRGRAIAFLEKLNVKRSTLQQQLYQPEFEAIKQVISGELKAVDTIIQEFIYTFELRELSSEQEQDQVHEQGQPHEDEQGSQANSPGA